MKIRIPARIDAPETQLYIEIMSQRDNIDNLVKNRSVMILVPGGPGGNHSVYNEIKLEFNKFADLILFDPRGCGYSDSSAPEFCTIHHYINDIEAIRAYYNLPKIVLYGGSYGSMAAIGYAIQHQETLEKLILSGGSPSFRFIDLARGNLRAIGTPEQIKAGDILFSGGFKNPEEFAHFYQLLAPLYSFHRNDADTVPTTKSNIPYNIAVTNLGFGNFLRKFNFEPDLQKISCETLIIFGQNDWINDPSLAVLLAEKIPNSKLVLLDECGHFIWRDQRDKYFTEIGDFLSVYNDNAQTLSSIIKI